MAVEGANQRADEHLAATTGTYAVNCYTGSGKANGSSSGMTLSTLSASVGISQAGKYRVTYIAVNTGSYTSGTTVTMSITCCGQKASTNMPLSNMTYAHVFEHEFDVSKAGSVSYDVDTSSGSYASFTTHILSVQRIG